MKTAGETKVDEEFAKSLGLDSLDKLKGLIRDQQSQELNGLTRTHMKRQLLDQLAARHDFDGAGIDGRGRVSRTSSHQLRHEASHEADPAGRARRDRSGGRRLSPDRRAPRAPRPAAVRDRRRQRRRDQRAGDEPPDRPGCLAVSGQGPRALHPATSSRSRWPPPSCAPRSTRTRSSIFCSRKAEITRPQGDPRRSSRPTSRARKAMSTGRAAATTMPTRRPRRRRPRRRARPRLRGCQAESLRPSPPRARSKSRPRRRRPSPSPPSR